MLCWLQELVMLALQVRQVLLAPQAILVPLGPQARQVRQALLAIRVIQVRLVLQVR